MADIENMEITIAGSVDVDGRSLVWFVTGNEYQAHSYFPMEFKVSEKDPSRFQFVKAYKAYERGQDIRAYPWNGYVFLINNPDCKKVFLDYGDGRVEEIEVRGKFLPEIYFVTKVPKEYKFLNEAGNEL